MNIEKQTVVKQVITSEEVVQVSIRMSPKELATVAAAMAVTSDRSRKESFFVDAKDQLDGSESQRVYSKLKEMYVTLAEEGAYGDE